MRDADLCFLTLSDAAKLIASRAVSPVELTRALLARVEKFDTQVNAFITVTAERALAQAKEAEHEIANGRLRGPLHGIPFGLKDLYNTAGILTSGHSKVCRDNIPTEDATAVAKLYDAGAVVLGKLATHEFAHGGPATDLPWPPARNPWNIEHFTGGSSSGPAAAVAASFMPLALGTDTGGSIRGPAAFCGIVGLRPTYGLVSRHGVMPSSFTFDACGPMTRTVEDCAIALQAIAGHDSKDPTSARRTLPDYRAALTGDIRGLRIGVVRHFWEEESGASEETRRAMDTALDVFERLGAKLETVRLRPLEDYYDVAKTIGLPELMAVHLKDLRERPQDFSAAFRMRGALAACLFQASDYVEAQRERRRMLAEVEPLYAKYDVFVTAGGSGAAPRLDRYRISSYWQSPNITTPFSVMGAPALVLCNGFSASRLPLGMQIAGRPFDEVTVLNAAYAYEQATDWRKRRPELAPGRTLQPVEIRTGFEPVPQIDMASQVRVRVLAEQAGLQLGPAHFAELCHAAPYAFAMLKRSRRTRCAADEPANVFRFPD